MRRIHVPFGAMVNIALLGGLALVVLVGFYAYRSIDALIDSGRSEARAFEDLRQIERIAGNLDAAESAQRKHLLTAEDADRLEFERIRDLVFAEIATLRARTPQAPQKLRLDGLREVAGQRFELLADAIRSRRAGGAAAALADSPRQRELGRRIDRIVDEFMEAEGRALRHREAETARGAATTTFMIVWGGAFAVALLLWAMVVINRYYAQRHAAEAALRASEAQLRLLIDAVPALIAYFDSQARLVLHNKTLERWFGAPARGGIGLREALGDAAYALVQPHLEKVFSGQRAQFTFAATAQDGRSLDLDATLVPRRDEAGTVTGCFVLVTDISELRRLERLKAEFVSTVSHELRTPVTSIRGSLGLLAGGAGGALPEAAAKLIEIAKGNAERLTRLVNDILDIEQLESGKMSFAPRAIDLGPLVAQSIGASEGFAAAHGVAMRLVEQIDGATVFADPDRLAQVMANLLSNACKFSAPESTVEVAVARNSGSLRVSVSDRGPGIPESFRPHLFERFSQADGSSARRKGGTGLGLAISRAIVERSGGEIGFEPRQGGGTTFYFELPGHRE